MTRGEASGPRPRSRRERRALVDEIARRLCGHFGDAIVALGVYGSVARDTDAAYSDVEMHCIVEGAGMDRSLEWSTGPWKAEVGIRSRDTALRDAAELDGTWSLTHGAFVHVTPLRDPHDFFAGMRRRARDHDDEAFRRVIRAVAVGDIYELVAKLRNLRDVGGGPALAMCAVDLARYAACLVGLMNRHLYASASTIFPESLELPVRPRGYGELCRIVSRGELDSVDHVTSAADALWRGVEVWADAEGLDLYRQLPELLDAGDSGA